ncbi:MAG: uroporphyrinogen decarboxylase family protein [Armatimonadota bacterium]
MTVKRTGPFYTLTDAQWARVRDTQRRFFETKDLGRALYGPLYGWDYAGERLPAEDIVYAGPRERDAAVDAGIRRDVLQAWRISQVADRCDAFPCLMPIRDHYGHSQRLAEPFGAQPYMEYGECQCVPAITSMAQVRALKPKAVRDCPYLSKSLALLRYLVESTEGRYPVRQMVTTSAFDTVNYITGTTLLLDSLYTHPEEVHLLLRMVTDILIEHIHACREIAGDLLVPDHAVLLRGYALCSELRSGISAEHYAEFEAPYLKEIGEAVGPLVVHGSGRWEQSLAATLADPNIIHLVLWVRDTQWPVITRAVGGQVSIDAWRSDLERYGFPDAASYYRYLFEHLQPDTRLTFCWYFDRDGYNQAYDALDREGCLPAQIRNYGRLEAWPTVRA